MACKVQMSVHITTGGPVFRFLPSEIQSGQLPISEGSVKSEDQNMANVSSDRFNLTRRDVLMTELETPRVHPQPSPGTTTSRYRARWCTLRHWTNFEDSLVDYWANTVTQADKATLFAHHLAVERAINRARRIQLKTEADVSNYLNALPLYLLEDATTDDNGQTPPLDLHSRIVNNNGLSHMAGVVDFVFVRPTDNEITALMEIKKPWKVTPKSIDEVLAGTAPDSGTHDGRLAVEQLYGYMVRNDKVLGLISTMKGWVFLFRENHGRLFMTRMYGCNRLLRNAEGYYNLPQGYTILKALYYFTSITEQWRAIIETRPHTGGLPSTTILANNDSSAAPYVGTQNFSWETERPQRDYQTTPNEQQDQGSNTRYETFQWQEYGYHNYPSNNPQGGGSSGGYQVGIGQFTAPIQLLFEPWKEENQLGHKTWLTHIGPQGVPAVIKAWDSWKQSREDRDNEVNIYLRLAPLWGIYTPHLVGSGEIDYLHCLIINLLERASALSKENITPAIQLKVIEAFSAIHSLGVIHGDIREENILVGKDGNIWVIDFEMSSIVSSAMGHHGWSLLTSEMATVKGLCADLMGFRKL